MDLFDPNPERIRKRVRVSVDLRSSDPHLFQDSGSSPMTGLLCRSSASSSGRSHRRAARRCARWASRSSKFSLRGGGADGLGACGAPSIPRSTPSVHYPCDPLRQRSVPKSLGTPLFAWSGPVLGCLAPRQGVRPSVSRLTAAERRRPAPGRGEPLPRSRRGGLAQGGPRRRLADLRRGGCAPERRLGLGLGLQPLARRSIGVRFQPILGSV